MNQQPYKRIPPTFLQYLDDATAAQLATLVAAEDADWYVTVVELLKLGLVAYQARRSALLAQEVDNAPR
jgi:hypothetical protein